MSQTIFIHKVSDIKHLAFKCVIKDTSSRVFFAKIKKKKNFWKTPPNVCFCLNWNIITSSRSVYRVILIEELTYINLKSERTILKKLQMTQQPFPIFQ